MGRRVLLIDDNAHDRTLLARELHREFPDLHLEPVIDESGFAHVLNERGFEVIITDYQLRWGNGLDVLSRAKAVCPGCLVIMFTGTGSEEIAVQAMKSGLDDYIIKSSQAYLRIPISLQFLFERREARRKAEQAAQVFRSLMRDLKGTEKTLQEKTDALDELADAVVHRELKVIELEKEVERLRASIK
jgi:DNA-binding NtrC family response regulator